MTTPPASSDVTVKLTRISLFFNKVTTPEATLQMVGREELYDTKLGRTMPEAPKRDAAGHTVPSDNVIENTIRAVVPTTPFSVFEDNAGLKAIEVILLMVTEVDAMERVNAEDFKVPKIAITSTLPDANEPVTVTRFRVAPLPNDKALEALDVW